MFGPFKKRAIEIDSGIRKASIKGHSLLNPGMYIGMSFSENTQIKALSFSHWYLLILSPIILFIDLTKWYTHQCRYSDVIPFLWGAIKQNWRLASYNRRAQFPSQTLHLFAFFNLLYCVKGNNQCDQIWRNFATYENKSLWPFLEALLRIWETFNPTLTLFYAIG